MMSGFASKKSFDGIMNPEKMKILWLKAQTVYVQGSGKTCKSLLCAVGTEEQERQ